MAEAPSSQMWLGRFAFAGLALGIIFVQLLPIDGRPDRWPFPDLLLAVTLAWVARRPDYAPVLLIATLFLLVDFLFLQPPGLRAALVLIATELVRARTQGIRNIPFTLEWAVVSGVILALTLANRAILAIAMTPQAPLGLTLVQMIGTILVYPLVIIIARLVFGVTRPAPGAVDSFGHRL
jgi:rod shape-determining protein MreD